MLIKLRHFLVFSICFYQILENTDILNLHTLKCIKTEKFFKYTDKKQNTLLISISYLNNTQLLLSSGFIHNNKYGNQKKRTFERT